MKTTFNLSDALVAEAKVAAAAQRTTLTRLLEEGLRMRLQQSDKASVRRPSRGMPVFKGGTGLAPGLSGLSSRELYDAADR